MSVGFALRAQNGQSDRFPSIVLAAVEPGKSDGGSTCPKPKLIDRSFTICEFGAANSATTLALYGDSHADALLVVLDSVLRQKNMRGVRVINHACHPIPDIVDSRFERDQISECPSAKTQMWEWLRGNADHTVVMMRWTYRLYPIPGVIDRLLFDNGEGGIETGDEPRVNFITRASAGRNFGAPAKREAIERFLKEIEGISQQLVLVYPVPEAGWDIPRYNMAQYLRTGTVPSEITTSMAAFQSRNQFVTTVLDGFHSPKVRRVKPGSLLCGTRQKTRCVASSAGIPLYYDDDHLSNTGAALVVDEIMRSLTDHRAGD